MKKLLLACVAGSLLCADFTFAASRSKSSRRTTSVNKGISGYESTQSSRSTVSNFDGKDSTKSSNRSSRSGKSRTSSNRTKHLLDEISNDSESVWTDSDSFHSAQPNMSPLRRSNSASNRSYRTAQDINNEFSNESSSYDSRPPSYRSRSTPNPSYKSENDEDSVDDLNEFEEVPIIDGGSYEYDSQSEAKLFTDTRLDTSECKIFRYTSFPNVKRLKIHVKDLKENMNYLSKANFPKLEELTVVKTKKDRIDQNTLSRLLSFDGLSTCKTLNFSDLGLTIFPKGVRNLAELKQLFLENNKIDEIPEWISSLKKLSQLYIKNNNLRDLPDSIVSKDGMEKLSRLEVQGNEIPEGVIKRLKGNHRAMSVLWK